MEHVLSGIRAVKLLMVVACGVALGQPPAALDPEVDIHQVDRLMFRAFSGEARQKKFLAELEEGAADSKLRRAMQRSKRIDALKSTNAASRFEQLDAWTEVIEASFERKRAKFHVEEFKEREKLWKFRSQLAPDPKRSDLVTLAKGVVSIYEARTRLLEELDKSLVDYLKTLDDKFDRCKNLFEINAMSAEVFEQATKVKDDAYGLAQLSRVELERSRQELDEANQRLGKATRGESE